MVYENENAGPTMPYYQFQQPMQMPVYYNAMYDEQPFYYEPPMYGGHMPQMNSGYIPPYMNGGYMHNPSYMNPVNYALNYTPDQNEYYEELPDGGAAANRVMQQFLDENGQVDFQKMLKTVGQFADTVQQVSPVIKQLNDLVRSFRA